MDTTPTSNGQRARQSYRQRIKQGLEQPRPLRPRFIGVSIVLLVTIFTGTALVVIEYRQRSIRSAFDGAFLLTRSVIDRAVENARDRLASRLGIESYVAHLVTLEEIANDASLLDPAKRAYLERLTPSPDAAGPPAPRPSESNAGPPSGGPPPDDRLAGSPSEPIVLDLNGRVVDGVAGDRLLTPYAYWEALAPDGRATTLEMVVVASPEGPGDRDAMAWAMNTELVVCSTVVSGGDETVGYLVTTINLSALALSLELPDGTSFPSVILVDSAGRPIAVPRLGDRYVAALDDAGLAYETLPLVNATRAGPQEREPPEPLPVIRILQQLDPASDDFVLARRPYRNYLGRLVVGSTGWVLGSQVGAVVELPWAEASRPYFLVTGLSAGILILAISAMLYLVLLVDRLRLKAFDANPLTGLPGNQAIASRLALLIEAKQRETIVYVDIDNFKAYNDAYGFSMGDEVITFTARVIGTVIDERTSGAAFCGHIGGDDFVFAVAEGAEHAIAEEIAARFDAGVVAFYRDIDRDRGGIESVSRAGATSFFPIMTISMAGVRLSRMNATHYLEVSNRCGEVKKAAKAMTGSVLVMDRREGH